jgi:hypothetical protein
VRAQPGRLRLDEEDVRERRVLGESSEVGREQAVETCQNREICRARARRDGVREEQH